MPLAVWVIPDASNPLSKKRAINTICEAGQCQGGAQKRAQVWKCRRYNNELRFANLILYDLDAKHVVCG
jgi:hypothetical protein